MRRARPSAAILRAESAHPEKEPHTSSSSHPPAPPTPLRLGARAHAPHLGIRTPTLERRATTPTPARLNLANPPVYAGPPSRTSNAPAATPPPTNQRDPDRASHTQSRDSWPFPHSQDAHAPSQQGPDPHPLATCTNGGSSYCTPASAKRKSASAALTYGPEPYGIEAEPAPQLTAQQRLLTATRPTYCACAPSTTFRSDLRKSLARVHTELHEPRTVRDHVKVTTPVASRPLSFPPSARPRGKPCGTPFLRGQS